MKISLAAITPNPRRLRSDPATNLVQEYLNRANQYEICDFLTFPTEDALLALTARQLTRAPVALVLLEGVGRLLSSSDFAGYLGRQRDSGRQHLVVAVGPADGWSSKAREHADLLLSLGPMTLPHALAQAVLAEQLYRALTILAGHPYHTAH